MGGFIVNNQFTYNGYSDYGLNYSYPNNQNYYRATRAGFQVGDRVRIGENAVDLTTGQPIPAIWHGLEDVVREIRNDGNEVLLTGLNVWVRAADVRLPGPGRASVVGGTWALTAAEQAANVSATEPRTINPGAVVGVRLTPPASGYRFVRWESDVPSVQFIPNAQAEDVLFVMPDSNITVEAVLNRQGTPTPPITPIQNRAVNVAGGFGGGFFPIGSRVEILATPVAGKRFVNWTVTAGGITLEDVNAPHTYFTLGDQDVVVTANFEDLPVTTPTRTVALTGGVGGGTFSEGARVEIVATPPTGQRFVNWTVTAGGVTLSDLNAAHTYFTLGNQDVAIRANFENIPVTTPTRTVAITGGAGGGTFAEGATVEISATPPTGQRFVNWTVTAGGVTLANANNSHTSFTLGNQNVAVRANFENIPATTQPTAIRVGDQVTVNQGVQTWATGEGMPSWVHGRTYPVIEIRTRNGVTELLLGNGINSWIRQTDVTRASEVTTPPVRVGDQVRVNSGIRTWATGEGMPSWVHGRTYPVIEIRTRSGITEFLLGNGINSWIRQPDVTRISGTSTNPIQINNRVRVNPGVQTWATGERMPSWVHGRTYPVVEIRTRSGITELLLGDINSWIRQIDVTRV